MNSGGPTTVQAMPFFVISTAASPADAFAFRARVSIRIVKWVAALAMRLAVLATREAFAAQEVFTVSNRFKMSRVYTMAHAAKVVENQTRRDRPDKARIGKSMSHPGRAIIVESPISIGADCPNPQPAASSPVFVDSWPELLRIRFLNPCTHVGSHHITVEV